MSDYGNLKHFEEANHEDNGVCRDCLMEHCGKSQILKSKAPLDFSFIFKDDKPVCDQKLIRSAQFLLRENKNL